MVLGLILGFFCCFISFINAQNLRESDSLEQVLKEGNYSKQQELEILSQLVQEETNLDKQLRYSLQLIIAAKEADSAKYEFDGYLQKGNALYGKGDLTKALESYFEASKIATDNKLNREKAQINIAIAGVYSILEDTDSSFEYYRQAIKLLLRQLSNKNDSTSLASAQLNFGDEFYLIGELDSALYYFEKSNRIFNALDNELGVAINKGNLGLVYAEKGDNERAEENLYDAIEVLDRFGDHQTVCAFLSYMSDIYYNNNEPEKALDYATRSYNIAKKNGLKDLISDTLLKLSILNESKGNFKASFNYYKDHIIYRDSVKNVAELQKQNNIRTQSEVREKQLEVDLEKEKRKRQQTVLIGIGTVLLVVIVLAFSLFKQNKLMKKKNEIIALEKERSDGLLKNILPEETAKELKENGTVQAKRFENVCVMFTDFKGFTSQSEQLSPEDLVKSIDHYFSKFDEIAETYDLEKIKTIGDSYMCAGGIPFPIEDQVAKVAQAALEMTEFVKQTKRSVKHKLAKFDIRIGIHSGPVVAGVVGTKKFQYDIWGDTVNTASRMESSGEIGKVNVSESVYNDLKDYSIFKFESRGALNAKGKNMMKMYFISYME